MFPAGNILGMVYGFRNGAAASPRSMASTWRLQRRGLRLRFRAVVDTPFTGSNAYHPFNLIVDSAGTAHILYVYVAKQNGPRTTNGTGGGGAGTVQAWSPAVILDAAPGTARCRGRWP